MEHDINDAAGFGAMALANLRNQKYFLLSLGHGVAPLFWVRPGEQLAATRRAVLMYVSEYIARRQYMIYIRRMANDQTFQMRASAEFLKSVDDWRRKQPDLPSRAEAIRRLVESALKAERKSR